MSKFLEDSCLDEVKNCDIFLLVPGRTLRKPVRQEYEEAVKASKPILILVKKLQHWEEKDREDDLRTFLSQTAEAVPKDNIAPYVPHHAHYSSLKELENKIAEGIAGEIARRLSREPIVTQTRQEMYELGTSLAVSARKRLYVAQRTPSLFFGARGYSEADSEKLPHEGEFNRSIEDWINSVVKEKSREFIYVYDAVKTKEEMNKLRLQQSVRDAIIRLKDAEKASGHRFRVSSAPGMFSGPIGLGDNWFALWLMGSDNAICVSHVNEEIADIIAGLSKQMAAKITSADQLLEELGISASTS